jgi:tetratricopeptide (TPR) repeat protein
LFVDHANLHDISLALFKLLDTKKMTAFLNRLYTQKWISLLLFLALGFMLYVNVMNGKFVFDDNIFIENNQFVKMGDIKSIFTSGITQGSGLNDNFYRPLQQSLYVLSYRISGNETWSYHLWNILFHSLNGFLLFTLLLQLFPNRRGLGLIVALLFLFHPLQTQAVSYISGLSEPLSGFFILLSLNLFSALFSIKSLLSKSLFGLAFMLTSLLALFAKENAVVIAPLSMLILLYQWKEGQRLELIHKFLPAFALLIGLGFVYLKMTALNFTGSFGLSNEENIYNENLSIRIITFINVFTEYLKMYLGPWHLHYETPYTAYTNFSRPQSVLAILLIGTWMGYGLWMYRKGDFLPFFSFAWFFIAIAPVSGIIPLNSIYLEHWLYLPQIGISILLVYFASSLLAQFSWSPWVLTPVLLFCSILVMGRNKDWADPERFYRNEIKYTKKSARMYNNLAMVLADKKDCKSAVPYYQKAIALYDIYPQSHHNLARCLEDLGYLPEAADEYFRALMLDPNFLYSHSKLPGVLMRLGDKVRAVNFLKLQVKMDGGVPLTQKDIQLAAQANPL